MFSRLAAVGVSGENFEKPTPASANPPARIERRLAAKTFEELMPPAEVLDVFESEPIVRVLVAANPSGGLRSRSTAMTTKTSLSSGLSCRSIVAWVNVFTALSETCPEIVMLELVFFNAMLPVHCSPVHKWWLSAHHAVG